MCMQQGIDDHGTLKLPTSADYQATVLLHLLHFAFVHGVCAHNCVEPLTGPYLLLESSLRLALSPFSQQ